MKVREMPQIVIRVTPKTKYWVINKAKDDRKSQNFIINKALEKVQEMEENAKQANTNYQKAKSLECWNTQGFSFKTNSHDQ